MAGPFLHYSRQFIDEDDIAAVTRVLRSDFLTTGPEVERLEKLIAEKTGAKFCVAVSSATAALHLAAAALEIGPGSALVTSPITFVATANAARFCGGGVYLSDVNPETANLDPACLRALLASRPKDKGTIRAVFPVHMGGQAAEMEEIHAIAREFGVAVVEDASHALGSTYADASGKSHTVGACRHSDMAVFSFHPVKPITTGEGGAITTNDAALYRRLQRLRAHGIERDPASWRNKEEAFDSAGRPNPWYYEMQSLGWNYRISDIHCALGCSQMGKLDWFVERRNAVAREYDTAFLNGRLAGRVKPLRQLPGGHSAYHIYVALIEFDQLGVSRADLMHKLRDLGFGTQVNYIPVHLQPYYAEYLADAKLDLPASDAYYRRALSLPISPGMEPKDASRVVAAMESILLK